MRPSTSRRPKSRHRRARQRPHLRTAASFAGATAVTVALAMPAFATDQPAEHLVHGQKAAAAKEAVWPYDPTGYGLTGPGIGSQPEHQGAAVDQDLSGMEPPPAEQPADTGSTRDPAPESGPAAGDAPPTKPGDGSNRRRVRGREGAEQQGRRFVRVEGMDVSGYQPEVDWKFWWRQGKRFVFIKATEGTNFRSPTYRSQWTESRRVGMLRGAYHFALPDGPTGVAQAKHFVANGGGSKADGWTLPGVLDIEFGDAVGKPTCYNRSPEHIVRWIRGFTTTYQKLTGRTAIIYTNATWWQQCTGNSTAFKDYPLWIASYNPQPGDLPGGWDKHLIWQFTDTPLDQNYFKGSYAELKDLASR